MKITVGLPSRNRPAGLLAALKAFDSLATGANEITYAVIMDEDDYVTLEQFEHWEKSGMLPDGVRRFVAPRNKTVNARFNDAMKLCPAEVYSQACDDSLPLAFHWDKLLAGAIAQVPAFNWQECNDPANATYPVLSQRWIEAVGRFYPEYFPFWFADTWIAEVFNIAFAKPIPVINQLQMGGKRGSTQGMRDLSFWFQFFAATRIERIAEATAVAKAFGFTLNAQTERAEILQRLRDGDTYQRNRAPVYEQAFKANVGEPSEVYKAAKFKAECWMADYEAFAA